MMFLANYFVVSHLHFSVDNTLIILNFTFVFRMEFLLFGGILMFKMFPYLLKQSNRSKSLSRGILLLHY